MVELSRNPYLLIESGLGLEEVYTAFMKIIMEGIVSHEHRTTALASGGDRAETDVKRKRVKGGCV
jgi:hypothetical protein